MPTCAGSAGSSAATGAKLSVVTVLIVVASALGVIPAFLLRDVFSKAFTAGARTATSRST